MCTPVQRYCAVRPCKTTPPGLGRAGPAYCVSHRLRRLGTRNAAACKRALALAAEQCFKFYLWPAQMHRNMGIGASLCWNNLCTSFRAHEGSHTRRSPIQGVHAYAAGTSMRSAHPCLRYNQASAQDRYQVAAGHGLEFSIIVNMHARVSSLVFEGQLNWNLEFDVLKSGIGVGDQHHVT